MTTKKEKCLNCNELMEPGKSRGKAKKFCSTKCKNQYHNRQKEIERKKMMQLFSKMKEKDAVIDEKKKITKNDSKQKEIPVSSFLEQRRNKKLTGK